MPLHEPLISSAWKQPFLSQALYGARGGALPPVLGVDLTGKQGCWSFSADGQCVSLDGGGLAATTTVPKVVALAGGGTEVAIVGAEVTIGATAVAVG